MSSQTTDEVPAAIAKNKSWLTGKWSALCRIVENTPGKRWSDICRPDGPGVYRLIALDATMAGIVPASLDRVCGVDPTGTLYIGFTKSLRTRLRILVLTNDPNVPLGAGHAFMPAKLRKSFPLRLRAVAWQRSASYDLARNGEKKLFDRYAKQFGELPPMNSQG